MFTPDRNTVGSRTLTTPRPHLTLIGFSTRWRAPLPSRLLVFTSCGPTFLPTPPLLLPSCLPISLFSITGVRILLLGSRSPIRHYYRHRAPVGVLVCLMSTSLGKFLWQFLLLMLNVSSMQKLSTNHMVQIRRTPRTPGNAGVGGLLSLRS